MRAYSFTKKWLHHWATASDFYQHFGRFACFISNKSTNCLGFSETAAHKWLTVFSLKIFEDNQIITNVKSNILLIIYKQQRKRIVFTRSNHHPNVFHKKVFCNIRETHRKTSLPESFLKQFFESRYSWISVFL